MGSAEEGVKQFLTSFSPDSVVEHYDFKRHRVGVLKRSVPKTHAVMRTVGVSALKRGVLRHVFSFLGRSVSRRRLRFWALR